MFDCYYSSDLKQMYEISAKKNKKEQKKHAGFTES